MYGEGAGEDMESYKPMLTINSRSTVPYVYSSICNTSNTGGAQADVRCQLISVKLLTRAGIIATQTQPFYNI